ISINKSMTFVGSLGFSSVLSQNKNSLRILNWNKKIITGLGQHIKKRGSFNTLSFAYSTLSSGGTTPTKIYLDADLNRSNIIKENKKKSGVYRWVNTVNGKSYIG